MGFTNAPKGNDKRIRIAECNNYGEINSQGARTAGIVAASNACTDIQNCENRGNQLNSMPQSDGSRLGNICCLTNNGSTISNCKNYGNLVSTTSGRVGGIVSLPNAGDYENNENYGEIISDSQYRGVFLGYVKQAADWKGGMASGKVGTYNGGTYEYDLYPEDEKVKYSRHNGRPVPAGLSTNITYLIPTGEEQPDPDLTSLKPGFPDLSSSATALPRTLSSISRDPRRSRPQQDPDGAYVLWRKHHS